MALTLTVYAGESVYIDGKPLKIVTTKQYDDEGGPVMAKTAAGSWELHEDRSVEVFPGVYVQLGTKNYPNKVSLAFEAPPEVKILTEKNYHALHAGQDG